MSEEKNTNEEVKETGAESSTDGGSTSAPSTGDTPVSDTPNSDAPAASEQPGTAAVPPKAPVQPQSESPASSGKKVEVDADVLEKLVSGYEGLQQKVKDLEGAADLGRLSRIQQARNQGKLVKSAKLSTYNNQIVLGWAKEKDDVYFDEAGRLHEDQQVVLYLDDGKDEKGVQQTKKTDPISFRAFARLTQQKIVGEVIGENKDKDGNLSFTLQLEDGREFTVPIVFLN